MPNIHNEHDTLTFFAFWHFAPVLWKNLIVWVKLKGPGSSAVPETKHIGHFIKARASARRQKCFVQNELHLDKVKGYYKTYIYKSFQIIYGEKASKTSCKQWSIHPQEANAPHSTLHGKRLNFDFSIYPLIQNCVIYGWKYKENWEHSNRISKHNTVYEQIMSFSKYRIFQYNI